MKKSILFAIILLYASVASAQRKLDLEAHRGGRGLMPENTIEAMINAVHMGVTTLEMDLGISKDGLVVVSHDSYMASDFMRKPDGTDINPSEEKSLLLYKMDYALIRSYDSGSKPHPQFPDQKKLKTYKPLFSELVDSVEQYIKKNHLKPVFYNVEIKSTPAGDGVAHPAPDVFIEAVMGIIKQKEIGKRVIIQSFDLRPLQILHKEYPKQMLSFLVANKDSFAVNIKNLGFTPDILSPYFLMVNEDLVAEAHKNNVRVIPWTVNTIVEMKRLDGLHVDGIISDFPNMMIDLFGSYH